jgi:hypothetical protein
VARREPWASVHVGARPGRGAPEPVKQRLLQAAARIRPDASGNDLPPPVSRAASVRGTCGGTFETVPPPPPPPPLSVRPATKPPIQRRSGEGGYTSPEPAGVALRIRIACTGFGGWRRGVRAARRAHWCRARRRRPRGSADRDAASRFGGGWHTTRLGQVNRPGETVWGGSGSSPRVTFRSSPEHAVNFCIAEAAHFF